MKDQVNDDVLRDAYDVVVAGGGAAGLSGALMLARARRSVAVIDAGAPRNAPAAAVHGLLARDGITPAELTARGRAEVRRHGGHVLRGEVTAVTRDDAGFTVTLTGGRTTRARRLLAATGLTDRVPDVPGLRERWGRDVVHCPYCHGWEVRDQPIAVLGGGPMSVHQALLFRQWSDDVVYLCHTAPPPTGEDAERLAARGVPVVRGEVTALEVTGDRLTGVRVAGPGRPAPQDPGAGTVLPRRVLAVAPRMQVTAAFLTALGLRPAEHPWGAGEYIPAEPTGATGVPGVWAAGNLTDPAAQVGAAAAAGATAAAHINADLIDEETRSAVAAHHDPFSAASEALLCETAMGDRRHGL